MIRCPALDVLLTIPLGTPISRGSVPQGTFQMFPASHGTTPGDSGTNPISERPIEAARLAGGILLGSDLSARMSTGRTGSIFSACERTPGSETTRSRRRSCIPLPE